MSQPEPQTAKGKSLGARLWGAGTYEKVSQIVAFIWTDLRTVETEAVAEYLATHPSLVDLDSLTTFEELAAAITNANAEHGIPADPGADEAAAYTILQAWRNLRGGKP